MTDRSEPLTPQTEAGRALYDRHRIHNQAQRRKADDRHDAKWAADILAIERAAAERATRQTPERDSGLLSLFDDIVTTTEDEDSICATCGVGWGNHSTSCAVPRLRAALATPEEAAPEGLDVAYRERNAVVAALIRTHPDWPCWIVDAPDAPGWYIVYAESDEGQLSWHLGKADLDLFRGLANTTPREWDLHTTEEKYQRVAALPGPRATTPAPTTEGLDVERLAVVLCAERTPEVEPTGDMFVDDECRSRAGRIAGEYARLSETDTAP